MSQLTHHFQSYVEKQIKGISFQSAKCVLELVEQGGTVPFIARYRKEQTGNLDEVQVRSVIECFDTWEELNKRRSFILGELEKQGNLSESLKLQISQSQELNELEELYRPFKRKKKTKATLAKEAGLEPLAKWLWSVGHGEVEDTTTVEIKAKTFMNPAAGFVTYDEVLRGAQHIIVERLSSNQELRLRVKEEYFSNAKLSSSKTTKFKPNSKYEMYADYSELAKNLLSRKASHRYLALRRGWQEGELKVSVDADDATLLRAFELEGMTKTSQASPILMAAAKQALTVHVVPSVVNELHSQLKDSSDKYAIEVFAENVRRVLLGSPFGPKVVLGVDPGLKTGCKLALVDSSGQYISHTVIHFLSEEDRKKAKNLFSEVFKQIKIDVVAVGNGTGGREAEKFIYEILKEIEKETPIIMVNESGASVYSASDVAREEFPDLDLTVRGAISIARRLQDPLAELVKIDPKSIGVGQYQHDVSATPLKKSLHQVVESCVNQVGVEINTASSSLLQYVSGIGPAVAKNIIAYRTEKGLFKEREELMKIPHFSSKVFEQSAGFLRVRDGVNILDRTGIHPERYSAVREMAQDIGLSLSQLMEKGIGTLKEKREKWAQLIGEYTFVDIINELEKPGRDPRDPFKIFKFREDIHEVKDLEKDMICPGLVTNVTNFGAFVDIGVHQDGLVHISELAHEFIDDPRKFINPGDQVKVKVLKVDIEKKQLSFSMLLTEKPQVKARSKSSQKDRGKKASSKKPQRAKGKRTGQGAKSADQSGGRARRPSKPFNNPFASLTGLKK